MAGPKPKYRVQLTEKQYRELKHLSQSHMAPWVEVQRARILLLAHEYPDWSNYRIAEKVGCGIDMVKKWRKRWQQLPSVKSLPRSGASRKFSALQRSRITALACSNPSDHNKPWKRWSGEKLAQAAIEKRIITSISASTIRRWLKQDKIKPWRYHCWQKSTDPCFVEKTAPVLDLYENAYELSQKGHAVICIDEKTSIQARQPLIETRPAIARHPVQVSDRYRRKGALQLFCALIVATGRTFARCFDRKCFSDFRAFLLKLFNDAVCEGLKFIHLILDNGTTHAPKQLEKWIGSLRLSFNTTIYWLPTHASWLDQVEIIFSKFQRDILTPSYFRDKDDLKSQIMAYFVYLNQNPKPIEWSYTKAKMLTKFDVPKKLAA
jgi:transposase